LETTTRWLHTLWSIPPPQKAVKKTDRKLHLRLLESLTRSQRNHIVNYNAWWCRRKILYGQGSNLLHYARSPETIESLLPKTPFLRSLR